MAFDALGGQKIPKVADLTKEYAALLAEKKECQEEYKAARKEMIGYQTAKMNVDKILGIEAAARERQQDRKTDKEVSSYQRNLISFGRYPYSAAVGYLLLSYIHLIFCLRNISAQK